MAAVSEAPMDNTPARRFRALVWLNLLCAMTLPGAVVTAQKSVDEGTSLSLSALMPPAGERPCTGHPTEQLEKPR